MAIKALNGFGWILTGVIVAPACYLVSSQVAAERSKVEAVERAIVRAHKDIRGLETEFDTRANLAQLERWNGEVMRYSAPTPVQFLSSDRELASLRPLEGDGMANRYAAMVAPHDMPQVISGAPSASDASNAGAGAGAAAAAVAAKAVAPRPAEAAQSVAKAPAEKPVGTKPAPAKVDVAKAAAPKPAPAKSAPEKAVAKADPVNSGAAKTTPVKQAAAKPAVVKAPAAKPGADKQLAATSAKPPKPSASDARASDTRVAALRPIPAPTAAAQKSGLERRLLKDSSFGDLMRDVRAEARGQR